MALLIVGLYAFKSLERPDPVTRSDHSFSPRINDFKSTNCGPEKCVQIHSEQAHHVFKSNGYYLENAKLVIHEKKTSSKKGAQKTLHAASVHLDIRDHRIYIKGIDQSGPTEAIYDLKNETLNYWSL